MARFGSIFGATAAALLVGVTFGVGSASAGAGDDCPPNPEPGKCYEKVYSPTYSVYTGNGYSQAREATFEWREVACRSGGATGAGGYRISETRVVTSPGLVRAVQSALMVEGYYAGPISGEDNAAFERGLNRYQYDRGLQPGWNQQTLRALGVPYPN